MSAAESVGVAVRRGQQWLFQGQTWKVHEVCPDGVIVLIGPHTRRDLQGVYAHELYEAGELQQDAPLDKATERIAQAFEKAQEKLRRPKRGPKPRPPAVHRPWKCTVLAVDTAKNSGWSLWVEGELRDYGEVKKDNDGGLLMICRQAHISAPAVLVLEAPSGMVFGGRGASVLIGLGKAIQAWTSAWRGAGGLKGRIVQVPQRVWRAALFGKTRDMKRLEQQQSALILKRYNVPNIPEVFGEDEAAALSLGDWARLSGEVGAALPATLRVFGG